MYQIIVVILQICSEYLLYISLQSINHILTLNQHIIPKAETFYIPQIVRLFSSQQYLCRYLYLNK